MDIRERVAELSGLGFDCIPLVVGGKSPIMAGWPRLAPEDQWRTAPADSNLGLRGGGDVRAVFLDADDAETWETARRYLAGLGYMPDGDYPLVATASGTGRHVYMTLADPIGGDWKRLRRSFGNGELRFGSGSYIVGVGSVVNGREYTMLAGDPRQLPRMERADLRELADIDADAGPALRPSVPGIPRGATALLAGRHVERYKTRSEAEMALITGLVNSGHDFGSVLVLFQTHPCAGKYAELRETKGDREALRWLRRSYDAAARWAETHESEGRKVARAALAWAVNRPWPGRTGNSDRQVFMAHATIAYQSGALSYAASGRRLAELAAVGLETAQKANRRLLDDELVRRDKASVATAATVYQLGQCGQNPVTYTHLYREEVTRFCPTSDAWRFRGLGKSALAVWLGLKQSPGLSVSELAERTGKCAKTVKRALEKMTRLVDPESAEVLRLVEPDGAGWRAVDADLDAVARAVGTAGAAQLQKAKHAKERAGWRRAITRQKAGDIPKKTR